MSGNPPTSTCPSSSITFGRVFEGTSLFGVFNFVNCNLQHFPIWSKWKLLKSTEESSFLMDFQPFNLQRSFAQSTERVDNLWRKYLLSRCSLLCFPRNKPRIDGQKRDVRSEIFPLEGLWGDGGPDTVTLSSEAIFKVTLISNNLMKHEITLWFSFHWHFIITS